MADDRTDDTTNAIPTDEWVPTRVFDSSDYLDGDPPRYVDDESDGSRKRRRWWQRG